MPPRARSASDRSTSESAPRNGTRPSSGAKVRTSDEGGDPAEEATQVVLGASAGGTRDSVEAGESRGFAVGGLRFTMPNMPDNDAKRLLWLGGLGALATIGILEWPVALVVGAGSVVAERLARANTPAPTPRSL
jgi:hypothetical protein